MEDVCSDSDSSSRGELVEWKQICEVSAEEVVSLAGDVPDSLLKYPLVCYSIVYRTIFRDAPTEASALVVVPSGVSETDMLAYFHGTSMPCDSYCIDMSEYAKSKLSYQTNLCVLPFASDGYVVVAPDYMGYGVSSDKEHPYMYLPELFKANIDAILAARSLMEKLAVHLTDNLFLTGWSQGASASISAHKYIQEQYPGMFSLTTSSLSGAYDFRSLMRHILGQPDCHFVAMSIYALAFRSMNHFSPSAGFPDDQMFRKNVDDQVTTVASLFSTPSDVFNPNFIVAAMNGTSPAIENIVAETSVSSGWTPEGRVILHHAKDDRILPYEQTISLYEGLGDSADVVLYSYEGGGHMENLSRYVENTLMEFAVLR